MYSSLTSAETALETIPDSYYLFLSPSDNFGLPEVLPDAPPVVPPVVILDVHLEVLTFSYHTEVIPTHPRSI